MVKAMCGIQLKARKRYVDLMFMLGLNYTIHAVTSSARWYGCALRREDGHVLRSALDFEIEGQSKKGRLKRT